MMRRLLGLFGIGNGSSSSDNTDQANPTSGAEEGERSSRLSHILPHVIGYTSTSPSTLSIVLDSPEAFINGISETCPICLLTFAAEEVATPDTCNHSFCVFCLERWSANANICPIDGSQYTEILVRHYPDGEITRRIPLHQLWRGSTREGIVLPQELLCALCREVDELGGIYVCFGCGHMYHQQCAHTFWGDTHHENFLCPFCRIIELANPNR
jgi:PHD and RING finger domain-containing protein 1